MISLTCNNYYCLYKILAGLPGVARALTTAQPPPAPCFPLALPLPSPPHSPTSPCRSTQHDLSRPALAPPPAPPPPRAPTQFLTPPRPVPGRPRPTCKVSALYLENCASALRIWDRQRQRQRQTDRDVPLYRYRYNFSMLFWFEFVFVRFFITF